jgi:hypothetical protein
MDPRATQRGERDGQAHDRAASGLLADVPSALLSTSRPIGNNRSVPGRSGSVLGSLLLALGAVLVSLALAEAGVRVHHALRDRAGGDSVPAHVRCDCAYLYHPNPAHPDISSQGLRDREFAIPRPPDTFRVLMLGDSVAFGANVDATATFPKRLETLLAGRTASVEVVNAGVSGYSTYNQLHHYLEHSRHFEPQLVVVAICLNDVVNPRLHWNYTREAVRVPEEAIPNREYDREHVLPLLEKRFDPARLARVHPFALRHSALLDFVAHRLRRRELAERVARSAEQREVWLARRRWPVHLTQEDSLGIDVLMDYGSPEWQWLRGMLDRLAAAVDEDGGRLALLVLPLGYQLHPNYPFLPQRHFERYCAERGVPCIDPLPRLRQHRSSEVFRRRRAPDDDVWHLTELGHEVVAIELREALDRLGLVPGGAGAPQARPEPRR